MSDSAVNALYDSACELLYAAQRVRRATERGGCEAAIAPTLGCVAEALEELAHCSDELCRRLVIAQPPSVSVLTASEALNTLTRLLADGRQACDDARAAAAAAVALHDERRWRW